MAQVVIVTTLYRIGDKIQKLVVAGDRLFSEQVAEIVGGFSFNFIKLADYLITELNLTDVVLIFPDLSQFVEET